MPRRNKHNLSHYHLLSCDMGQLIPIGLQEALPGDTFQHHSNVLVRVSPLVAPVMHPVTARVHHFFVPNRLIWAGWEDFITGGPDGDDASEIPTMGPNPGVGQLADYLGIPPNTGGSKEYSQLPFRAYNLIYNEYYRDQDLTEKRAENASTVAQIAWEKDYFTSARPWTQKGPDVTVPLGDRAPVIASQSTPGTKDEVMLEDPTGDAAYLFGNPGANQNITTEENITGGRLQLADISGMEADLSAAVGGNINDIRRAFAIQRYQEARARYGSRYTEYLRYLGVNPKDARLQRPEYLGGGQSQINFSEVLQTSPETRHDDPPEVSQFGVGDMYGHGIAAMRSNKYRRFIEEHGYIMTLLSVRPKAVYTQGLHRHWLRKDKEDFYQRELEHIGQQEIFNDEIYNSETGGNEVFGYQDRYRCYREQPSRVSGEFRNTLNYWHMGREFESQPVLNHSFVECNPTKRIHNEQTMNSLWIMVQHKIIARRLLSRNASARVM